MMVILKTCILRSEAGESGALSGGVSSDLDSLACNLAVISGVKVHRPNAQLRIYSVGCPFPSDLDLEVPLSDDAGGLEAIRMALIRYTSSLGAESRKDCRSSRFTDTEDLLGADNVTESTSTSL